MLQYDFQQSPGYWLVQAHQAYMRTLAEELAPHGITFRQAQVLGCLSLDGPQPQAELAARMMIEPPSLVGTLDRMEQNGLIERRPCPRDRRKKFVHPLPAAEEVWQKIARCGRKVRLQSTQGMTAAEIAMLKQLLEKMRANISTNTSLEEAS